MAIERAKDCLRRIRLVKDVSWGGYLTSGDGAPTSSRLQASVDSADSTTDAMMILATRPSFGANATLGFGDADLRVQTLPPPRPSDRWRQAVSSLSFFGYKREPHGLGFRCSFSPTCSLAAVKTPKTQQRSFSLNHSSDFHFNLQLSGALRGD